MIDEEKRVIGMTIKNSAEIRYHVKDFADPFSSPECHDKEYWRKYDSTI